MRHTKKKSKALKKLVKPRNIHGGKRLKPISLRPLDVESALRAAIATGPITDPDLKKRRGG